MLDGVQNSFMGLTEFTFQEKEKDINTYANI